MLSIDEAISHAREVAERNRKQYKNCPADRRDIEHQTCEQCVEEHEQIAEWLEELKDYRDKNKMVVRIDVENIESVKDKINKLSKEQYNKGYADGSLSVTSEIRNKVIDDFVKALQKKIEKDLESHDLALECKKCGIWKNYDIVNIAEQLKVGGKNETDNT